MKKKKSKKPVWENISSAVQNEIKHLNKMKKRMKTKILFTIVLPVFLVVLAFKVFQTFLRIKLKEIAAAPETVSE